MEVADVDVGEVLVDDVDVGGVDVDVEELLVNEVEILEDDDADGIDVEDALFDNADLKKLR